MKTKKNSFEREVYSKTSTKTLSEKTRLRIFAVFIISLFIGASMLINKYNTKPNPYILNRLGGGEVFRSRSSETIKLNEFPSEGISTFYDNVLDK